MQDNFSAEQTIEKAQYALKAKIYYYFFSKLNLIILCVSYIFSFQYFIIAYVFSTLLIYKFIFSKTRGDNPYKIFLLHLISLYLKNIRSKA